MVTSCTILVKTAKEMVGIILSPGLKEGVLQVNWKSDRLIWIKLAVGNMTVNVVSAYIPQVGTTDIERNFLNSLRNVIMKILRLETV